MKFKFPKLKEMTWNFTLVALLFFALGMLFTLFGSVALLDFPKSIAIFTRDFWGLNKELVSRWSFTKDWAIGIAGFLTLIFLAIRSIAADQQRKIAKVSALHDRFQKAASMLGDKRQSVRQAGIFTLKRLAVQEDEIFCDKVLDVISAFIRDRSEEVVLPFIPAKKSSHREALSRKIKHVTGWPEITPYDIKTANRALLDLKQSQSMKNKHIDLRLCILCGIRLADGQRNFTNMACLFSNLEGANLGNADISNSNFHRANLEDADFSNVSFQPNAEPDFFNAKTTSMTIRSDMTHLFTKEQLSVAEIIQGPTP
ncbi:pentapeptide repeat-containing protein [Pseudovibrio sp. POLY-S9]|uniref:pentapeptide repeat-containing protein n=1 Tax=Pseudovibrio sp. POLY-S9 TaxID=1576596 RepID=UPI00070BD4F4|nr:pentapeptide repeat-containing protein [Pseudovibrio sp. POLY-S9]